MHLHNAHALLLQNVGVLILSLACWPLQVACYKLLPAWEQPSIWAGDRLSATRLTCKLPLAFTERVAYVELGEARVILRPAAEGSYEVQHDSWFITRKCDASTELWGGLVRGIYRCESPFLTRNGCGKFDVVLDVEWHTGIIDSSGSMLLDSAMNLPMLAKAKATVQQAPTRYWLARDTAPVKVHVFDHPTDASRLVVTARSFSFTRVAGWGKIPPLSKALAALKNYRARA